MNLRNKDFVGLTCANIPFYFQRPFYKNTKMNIQLKIKKEGSNT